MKAASISDIKNELKAATPAQLTALCLRLARAKKENKELLTFLLFEAHNLPAYLLSVKEEIDEGMQAVNWSHVYFAKKSIRKLLRVTNKYIKYAGDKTVAAELLLYFCAALKKSGKHFEKSGPLAKLYAAQLHKAKAVIAALHPDLQHDFQTEIEKLS